MTTRKPKAPVDYSKARLYVIRSPHTDKVYIEATTTQLSKRLYHHKDHFKQWTNGKNRCITSFEILQAGDAYIELLKECPCENKEQLAKYEGEAIRNTATCCNKIITGRTKSEYREQNKDKIKEYYEANEEAINQQKKKYREANKEAIRQQKKEYYEANKEAMQQQKKEYREANKEAILRRAKEYREANKEKIKQQKKECHKQYYEANKQAISQRRRELRQQKKQQINNEIINTATTTTK